SSYLPLNVQIIKASATKVNVDLLNLKLLKLERTGYGGLQRAAVTATNPRNPEAQVHGGHGHGGHGHGTPVQPLAPEVYFGTPPSPSPTTAPPPGPDGPEMPPPQPGGQVPPTAPPDPIHEVESQPSTGALLTPVLERYETLNWEAALVLASHYRPLDGQLDHLRKELAELSESLRSIDPENKLEAAADLRAGLDKLGKAISAAEGLPRAPQPKSLEEDYAKVKGKQSEPLAATIKLAKDPKILPKILTTAAPVAPGQRFYAEDQRYLACAVHALNAFSGGPLVSVEALSEFNMVQAHVEQVAPLLHVPD